MSAAPVPPTHTVVVSRGGGKRSQFTSHSEEDATYVASRFVASGFEVQIEPVEPSPIVGQLREEAA